MAVKAIPEGYHSVIPYILSEDAPALIAFLKQVFEATEQCLIEHEGQIRHAEMKIGDSVVMLGQACGEWKAMPNGTYVYVNDVDAVYQRALKAGATSLMEPTNQYYGDRSGGVKDAMGNVWWIATHVEEVPREELEKRGQAAMAQKA